jgi:hypothetical protein
MARVNSKRSLARACAIVKIKHHPSLTRAHYTEQVQKRFTSRVAREKFYVVRAMRRARGKSR